jgi:hypothetical protein
MQNEAADMGTGFVTEAFGAQAGQAAVSCYRISEVGAAPISRSVGNGRSEICWAVVTNDGGREWVALSDRLVGGSSRDYGRARCKLRRTAWNPSRYSTAAVRPTCRSGSDWRAMSHSGAVGDYA